MFLAVQTHGDAQARQHCSVILQHGDLPQISFLASDCMPAVSRHPDCTYSEIHRGGPSWTGIWTIGPSAIEQKPAWP
jgi:hypothetical protein